MGKTAGDLVGPDIMVTADGDVLGTMKYVPAYTGFSNNPDEQYGYYFPFHLGGEPGEKMTLSVDGTPKKQGVPYDPDIIFRIAGPDTRVTVGVDGRAIVKLNFKRATFAPKGKVTKKEANEALNEAAQTFSDYATVSVTDGKIAIAIKNEDQDINTEFGRKLIEALTKGSTKFKGLYVKGHKDHTLTISGTRVNLLDFKDFVTDSGLAGSNKLGQLKGKSVELVFIDIYDEEHEYNMVFAS